MLIRFYFQRSIFLEVSVFDTDAPKKSPALLGSFDGFAMLSDPDSTEYMNVIRSDDPKKNDVM